MLMTVLSLTAALKQESLRLGFDLVGIAAAVATTDFDRLEAWLADGCAGEMRYFANRLDAYRHPSGVLEGVKSIVVLGANYRSVEPANVGPGQARISGTPGAPTITRCSASGCARWVSSIDALCPRLACGAWSTRPRFSSGGSANWPGSVGSARTRCSSTNVWAVGSFWPPC